MIVPTCSRQAGVHIVRKVSTLMLSRAGLNNTPCSSKPLLQRNRDQRPTAFLALAETLAIIICNSCNAGQSTAERCNNKRVFLTHPLSQRRLQCTLSLRREEEYGMKS